MKRSFVPALVAALILAPLLVSEARAQAPTGFDADGLPFLHNIPSDRSGTASLNSATLNTAATAPLGYGQAVVGWNITGLAASGATLTPEFTNDPSGATGWTAEKVVASGALSSAITADGPVVALATAHTYVRLRVSTVGTGTVVVTWNASIASGDPIARYYLSLLTGALLTSPNACVPVSGSQEGLSVAAATALTVPAGANTAIVTVENTSVRWSIDPSHPPTASAGSLLAAGTQGAVFKVSPFSALKFIQTGDGAALDVEYCNE
jgi:hypothetical protein